MDSTQRKVASTVLKAVRYAYAIPDGTDHPDLEPCLVCDHGLGAHHGPDGEQRCGEDGCSCVLPRYASRSHYSADDDLVGTDDHNRRIP